MSHFYWRHGKDKNITALILNLVVNSQKKVMSYKTKHKPCHLFQ